MNVYAIALIKTGSLAKTSSGKIQRRTCRSQFLAGELAIVGQWQASLSCDLSRRDATDRCLMTVNMHSESFLENVIESWLVSRLAQRLGLADTDIDSNQPFSYYGLGSMDALDLAADLEAWLNRTLSPTLPWEYPSIQTLTQHLVSLVRETEENSESKLSQTVEDTDFNQLLNYVEHLSEDDARKVLEQSKH